MSKDDYVEIGLVDAEKKWRKFVKPINYVLLSATATDHLLAPTAHATLFRELFRRNIGETEFTFIFTSVDISKSVQFDLPRDWCLIDAGKLKRVREARTAHAKILTLLDGVDREVLSPYQDYYAATGRMFFGRTHVLRDLHESAPRGLVVYGPRSVGKTSVVRRFCEREGAGAGSRSSRGRYARHIVYVNCVRSWGIAQEEGIWKAITGGLGLTGQDELFRRTLVGGTQVSLSEFGFLDKLLDGAFRYLTIVLDEVDNLISLDRMTSAWSFFSRLRSITTDAEDHPRARVVLVGFRNLYAAMHDNTFPFYERLKPVSIPPLEPAACEQLVRDPLHELGIDIRDEKDVVARLRHETGGMPAVLQRLCCKLVELARQHGYVVTPALVEECLASTDYVNDILGQLNMDMSPLERLAIYYAAEHEHLKVGEFADDVARLTGRRPDASAVVSALERACLANFVAAMQEGQTYVFAVPAVAARLRDDHLGAFGRDHVLQPIVAAYVQEMDHEQR